MVDKGRKIDLPLVFNVFLCASNRRKFWVLLEISSSAASILF